MLRLVWLSTGVVLIAAGAAISPLPGPWSFPIVGLGLLLVLRHSAWARRRYIRLSRRWPRWFAVPNRFLRRKRSGPATETV